ncbi:MAG: MopE-related protein [Myxococcaceae bacterium]|nr:MopE-related protein [Myxococcaceae bacterium]
MSRLARASSWSAAVCALLFLSDCTSCARQPAKDTLFEEGRPCDLDETCETGLCDVVPGTSDRVCLRKCTTGCRESDQCTRLAADRYACVPQRAGLCQSCQQDADCPYPADRCITLGADKFCGRDCSFDSTCPSTFRCADAIAVDGTSVTKQCQPTSGTCACIAATAGQTMPCEVTNSFGTCLGSSTCTPPMGWAECTARTPIAELCNGRDDDCDGMTDEEIPDVTCGVGECERRVAACFNGRPATCTPGMPDLEVCNRKDDNCDGRVDENFDLQNDVGNCGTCNRACAFTNAVPKCDTGTCAIDRCIAGWVNLDGVAANGCEHPCTPSNGGVEVCDGRDNNCDGRTDEGFDLVADPMNCGQCGLVCNVANGSVSSYRCNAGRCAVGQCSMGRGDCNQVFADGCEENLVSSLTHCGQCGMACTPANATGLCQMGNCRIGACNVGFRDCNAMAQDGCEIETNADVNNCGQCGRVCSAANATSACSAGACTFTCLANWYDVDNSATNGCEYACVRTNNGVEACDGIDNDCDGRIDEDFNLMTDAANCGMCNRACIPPPFVATTACGGGQCGLTACVPSRGDCNASYVDGCEVDTNSTVAHCGQCGRPCNAPNVATYTCTSGACGINTCAPGRGNCNNTYMDGCEVDTNTSVANCGQCGNACSIPNGTPRCTAGTCQVNTCTGTFRDCNASASDGCETNVATSVANCGGCGQACSRPFTTASCANSSCQFVCLPGRFDLDGDPTNGCEYGCTPTGSDLPDLNFEDANCDGFDGESTAGIYVAKTGNDSNPGTRAAPRLTITGGINQARALGRTQVFISEGQYDETLTYSALESGISLFGGYSVANNWARSNAYVTVINSTNREAVVVRGVTQPTQLQLLTIRSANAAGQEPNGDGRSSVAVLADGNSGLLFVNGCTLRPGTGSPGGPGAGGSTGAAGSTGGVGNATSQGSAGAAGPSACGAPGGQGGVGVGGETNGNNGITGATASGGASGGNPGRYGDRGGCSTFSASDGKDAPAVTASGAAGIPGPHGFPGPGLGSVSSGLYTPPPGLPGSTGQTGGGGGGGGSGGGTQRGSGLGCLGCSSLTSGGGGGGGGGGCGGTGGQGGRGGGGSFGVLASNAPVSVQASTIVTAAGGVGGTGGAGGPGGTGGPGGGGGAGQTYSGGCNSRRAGNGAMGASGGGGGAGGGGSGGPGGPSVCVAFRGVTATLSGGSCVTASPASGGPGGSNGMTSAPPGTVGVATNIVSLP